MQTKIHSYESFGTVDGPGIRFIVFFQGCPLRCAFCHNPDTWKLEDGKTKSTDEIVKEISKYKTYFKNGGGVTISGGEPLLQLDALIELCTRLKQEHIHVCIDTSGITYNEEDVQLLSKQDSLLDVCDLFLLDIKHIDAFAHKELTGLSNEPVLAFARYLDAKKMPVWIRHVLVPNDSAKIIYLKRLREFLDTLHNVEKIEVLPYHTMGVVKYKTLGIPYRLEDVQPPTKEEIDTAKRILNKED